MQALILAGGLGTRLRTVVNDKPKPMAAVGGKPFIEYQIAWLKKYQVTDLVLCVGYRHEQIRDYFAAGERWGVSIKYSIEDELLGTAGALKLAQRHVTGPFGVLNGDSFFDIDLNQLMQFQRRMKAARGSLGTLSLTDIPDAREYGAVTLSTQNQILRFEEKSAPAGGSETINAGIYILEPEILNFIPAAQKVSLERETFPAVLQQGHALFGYRSSGYFIDIGTPSAYQEFQKYIAEKDV
ncbi:MAG: nucleotidyltransferase family protein [bacterium]